MYFDQLTRERETQNTPSCDKNNKIISSPFEQNKTCSDSPDFNCLQFYNIYTYGGVVQIPVWIMQTILTSHLVFSPDSNKDTQNKQVWWYLRLCIYIFLSEEINSWHCLKAESCSGGQVRSVSKTFRTQAIMRGSTLCTVCCFVISKRVKRLKWVSQAFHITF